jgi:DNA (cytosine-5)-methyltransferase 1
MPTRSTKIGDGVACLPFLLDRRTYNDGDAPRIKPITEPVGAITANGRPHTLVTPPMIVPAGGSWNQAATSVDDPIRTRMTRDTDGLLTPQPWITVLRNHADATPITDPLATVATGGGTGGGHQGLTVPPGAFIQKHHGGMDYKRIAHMTKSVNDPLPSVVARPNLSLVIPYRKGKAKTTGEPLHTVATRDSAALVAASTIDIDDCRFRMLTPREHARAQRFPDYYRVIGNRSFLGVL